MKKLIWIFALAALAAFGGGKDTSGNVITENTLLGNVDGEQTKVGDINALKIETDPTVPSWAKTTEKPHYTAGEVGARSNDWMPSAVDVGAVTPGGVTNIVTKAYVESLGIEAGVSASAVTNIANAAIAAATNGLASTHYVDAAVASATPGDYLAVSNRAYAAPVDYCWSSPNEWHLTFTRGGSTSYVSTPVKSDYEGWSIISNVEVTTTYTRNAQAVPVTVDETSYAIPNVTNWSVSSGAAITTAGLVSSDADGIYRVTAKAATGTRYGDVILHGNLIVVETNSYHAADVAGTGTKAVNDAALAKLNAATKVGTYTREGKTYSVYNAEKVYITKTGAGNVAEFAVSAHILGTAAHYGSYIRWLGTQTFTAPDGTTATVTKKKWYNLRDWALENGWSAAEIDAAGVADIALVVCDGATAVPDGCIPYFMSPTTALAKYGKGQGIAAWKCSQFHDYALPVTLINWRLNLDGYTGDTARYWVRSDILSRLADMGAQNYVQSGDSGKPTYIVDSSGRTVVVSANTSPNYGPDYVNGFYIIKAFVEAMGDTLKEAN